MPGAIRHYAKKTMHAVHGIFGSALLHLEKYMTEKEEALFSPHMFPVLNDHERRITDLEQGVATIQLKLVEVQTEGRMRGERQDRDTRELKILTESVKGSVDDILRTVSLLFKGLKWSWGAVLALSGFIGMYGASILHFLSAFAP